jgi:hypothetical protein
MSPPRGAITDHDLGCKRSAEHPTGQEIELFLAQPSLRTQLGTCGAVALLADEHKPLTADRLRWHIFNGEHAIAECLALIPRQTARADVVLASRRHSLWSADLREVTAQRCRAFDEPSLLPLLRLDLASIDYESRRGAQGRVLFWSECRDGLVLSAWEGSGRDRRICHSADQTPCRLHREQP